MDADLLTVVVSGASGVFILDRVITLVRALRSSPPGDANNLTLAVELEQMKTNLERIVDSQETLTEMLRQVASGQGVLLDRRSTSLSPRTIELVQTYTERRRRQREELESSNPPPPKIKGRRPWPQGG